MSPRAILPLPPNQLLNWDAAITGDGRAFHTTSVAQPRLQDPLNGKPLATGALADLQAMVRRIAPGTRPRVDIGDAAFKKLQQIEPVQQQVSQLIPHRANSIFSIVATGGESFVRFEMRRNSAPPAQYSMQAVRDTLQSGSGVCTETNHALFMALAAHEKQLFSASMRERSLGRPSSRDVRPLSFAQNHNPHGFVLWGDLRDPRQAPDVLVADSWEPLPIVKTWANTEFKNRPFTVKKQMVAGTPSFDGMSLQEMASIAAGPQKSAEVDAWLAQQGRPRVGPDLLKSVYEICARNNLSLTDTTNLAQRPDLSYRNASTGEVFSPSIALHDYGQYRMAMSNLTSLTMFGELVDASRAST